MELPVYENQAPVGKLRIRPQGLYTVFEARLSPGPGLSRLWLLGAGRRYCLGLLEPREEGRFLRRCLTRLQLTALPPRIDTALVLPSDAGAPGLPRARGRCPEGADEVLFDLLKREEQGHRAARGPHQSPAATASPCAEKPLRIPHSEFSWTRRPDGSLVDPARRLLALPCAPGAAPAAARKITLDGREYWLFRY